MFAALLNNISQQPPPSPPDNNQKEEKEKKKENKEVVPDFSERKDNWYGCWRDVVKEEDKLLLMDKYREMLKFTKKSDKFDYYDTSLRYILLVYSFCRLRLQYYSTDADPPCFSFRVYTSDSPYFELFQQIELMMIRVIRTLWKRLFNEPHYRTNYHEDLQFFGRLCNCLSIALREFPDEIEAFESNTKNLTYYTKLLKTSLLLIAAFVIIDNYRQSKKTSNPELDLSNILLLEMIYSRLITIRKLDSLPDFFMQAVESLASLFKAEYLLSSAEIATRLCLYHDAKERLNQYAIHLNWTEKQKQAHPLYQSLDLIKESTSILPKIKLSSIQNVAYDDISIFIDTHIQTQMLQTLECTNFTILKH